MTFILAYEVFCEKLNYGDLLVQDGRGTTHEDRHTVPDYVKEQIFDHFHGAKATILVTIIEDAIIYRKV